MTRRQAGSCGVRFPAGARNFHFSKAPTPALRLTQPPTKSVPVDCFHGVKWPGREADHTSRLRMSVPVPLLPLHVFKQGQQGQLQLFTYFLLTIIVPFSWYSPIQLIQSHSADTVPFSWQSPIQLIQSHSADTVPFRWYSPITNLQKFETYGETGGQYVVVTLEHSFPYKSWKPGAMPHKKVPE